jgi:hypothetical protein
MAIHAERRRSSSLLSEEQKEQLQDKRNNCRTKGTIAGQKEQLQDIKPTVARFIAFICF